MKNLLRHLLIFSKLSLPMLLLAVAVAVLLLKEMQESEGVRNEDENIENVMKWCRS
jgi:hypothetical protein